MKESNPYKAGMNRRRFFGAAAASAFTFQVVPQRVFGANERLQVACIGIGGKGYSDVTGAADAGAEIVALCDVDEGRRKRRGKDHRVNYPSARFYEDFRRMLEKEAPRIDAVTVSTPDHTHATASLMAMKLGKHVYCQKPLTWSIHEAREMSKAAKEHNVVTQMGNQAHAGEPIRRAVELIRAGIIGRVTEAHIWTNRPIWPQGIKARPPGQPVPSGLDWDLWLGPAPWRDYNEAYAPFKWRGWWDFGTGALGDMACHIMDMTWWSLELGAPTSVEAEQGGNTTFSPPEWSRITYRFPTRGDNPPVKLVWYDGKKNGQQVAPSREITGGVDMVQGKGKFGSLLIGDKGRFFFNRGKTQWMVTGRETDEVTHIEEKTPRTIPRVKNEDQEWVDGCLGGDRPLSNFGHSGPFTEMVLLGNLALRSKGKIEWNAKKLQVTNSSSASQYIRREPRKGWEV